MKYAPHALRRSVPDEVERCSPEERATASSRFRGLDDLSVVFPPHRYNMFSTTRFSMPLLPS
ncbi:stealth conserved region 3 domain-containing protein [Streptomyces iconiensis]|uniref:stealth conserved region 3 domain-containing protein n=1 Tax=Streptomyces iconiensis TaxID=1384038 RepID=UPI003D2F9633